MHDVIHAPALHQQKPAPHRPTCFGELDNEPAVDDVIDHGVVDVEIDED
jgi:hypothetical protein